MLGVVESVVGKRGSWVRVRRGKSRDGRGPIIHFKGGGSGEGFVGNGVVGEADALGEGGPEKIVRWGEEFHGSVPKSPPAFDLPITLCVVAAGGGAGSACRIEEGGHEFREEFRRGIGVDDVGGATTKENLVE